MMCNGVATLLSLLYGLGIVPLGPQGWQWLTDVLLTGGCVMTRP